MLGRQLVGHVDNGAYPAVTVDIQMIVVTPVGREGAGAGDDHVRRPRSARSAWLHVSRCSWRPASGSAPVRPRAPPPGADPPPATEQLIAAGWGYATLNPASIQADNGAGLTKGIIGLVNKGQPRKPDDWGALRAWAWGASRALDYLETDTRVDAKKVGIEGVSRYGKAALVTMAFDPRFAVVLVGSSGEGGAKLHRRNFGEAVENLTGSGEYHWMAGNFLKYGAAEADVRQQERRRPSRGRARADRALRAAPDLHQLRHSRKGRRELARPAGQLHGRGRRRPVFRLLGAKDLGRSDDYDTEKMPRGEHGPARRRARLASARRRAHRRPELEILHPVGRQVPRTHAAPAGRGGSR